jgi:hypothetical protein
VEIESLQRKLADAERRSLVSITAPALVAVAPVLASPIPAVATPAIAQALPANDVYAPELLDASIDGSRRRRRIGAAFAIAMLVVFGGLLGSMALSYV